jgi:hypothetical protein
MSASLTCDLGALRVYALNRQFILAYLATWRFKFFPASLSTSVFRAWFLRAATRSVVERRQIRLVEILCGGNRSLARRNEVEFS